MKTILHIFLIIIGLVYLMNPTAGIIEIIPDNFPMIGNLDEAAAVLLVLSSLRFFGFDFTRFFLPFKKDKEDK